MIQLVLLCHCYLCPVNLYTGNPSIIYQGIDNNGTTIQAGSFGFEPNTVIFDFSGSISTITFTPLSFTTVPAPPPQCAAGCPGPTQDYNGWLFGVSSVVIYNNSTPMGGTISANTLSGPPGTPVTITGTGWQNGSATGKYQILLDGSPVLDAVQGPIASCSNVQPGIIFDILCNTPVGN